MHTYTQADALVERHANPSYPFSHRSRNEETPHIPSRRDSSVSALISQFRCVHNAIVLLVMSSWVGKLLI